MPYRTMFFGGTAGHPLPTIPVADNKRITVFPNMGTTSDVGVLTRKLGAGDYDPARYVAEISQVKSFY